MDNLVKRFFNLGIRKSPKKGRRSPKKGQRSPKKKGRRSPKKKGRRSPKKKGRRSPKKKGRKMKIITLKSNEPLWVKKRMARRKKKIQTKKQQKLRERRGDNVEDLTKLFAKMDTKSLHKFNKSPRKRRSPKKYRIGKKRKRSYNKKLLLFLATIGATSAKSLTLKEEEKFRKMIAKEFKDCKTIPQKYRKLALKNHPDKGGNPAKMVLLNKEKEKYDKKCKKGGTSLTEGIVGVMAGLGTLEYRRRKKTPKKTKPKRKLIRRRKKGERGF